MSLIQELYKQVEFIRKNLQINYIDLLSEPSGLWQQVQSKIDDWRQETKQFLLSQFPFEKAETNLAEQFSQFQNEEIEFTEKQLNQYQQFCKKAQIPFNETFWLKQFEQENENKKGKHKSKRLTWSLMLEQWQKQLDKAKSEWYLNQLNHLRQKFLQELEKYLENIRELSNKLAELGLEPGILLDNSIGNLTPQSITELKRWLDYLKNNEGAQKIAELLGKMRQIEKSEKIEKIQKTISVSTPTIDINSREEIIGLRLAKELEYILPSELALMSDASSDILFDLKYLENKLMCFELQSIQYKDKEIEITIEQKSSENEKLGPMILCVDTSGSMQGIPEYIAKAMALYLSNKAKSEKRSCFIINFSTKIEVFEINEKLGISDLIEFLRKSFHGGTDVAPALRYALKLMETEQYSKADILLISDFIMGSLPDDILKEIANQREKNNKFNSLVIGDTFMYQKLNTYFDHEWIYNHKSQNIQELVHFKARLTNIINTSFKIS